MYSFTTNDKNLIMINYRIVIVLISLFFFLNCKKEKFQPETAQSIIDKSILVSGGEKFENSTIVFDFRDKHYLAKRDNGSFQLERHFKDSLLNIKDILNNKGFKRFINESEVEVIDSMVPRYSASVNSVHYFSVLPYGLNAKAVNKTYLEKVKIKGKTYYKVKVTFSEEGGGEDFEDVFVYWFNSETYKVDYIAYSYNENEDLGMRFREAYNERFVNGIRFVDYNNYKPKNKKTSLLDLDKSFENNELELLSKIELKNIEVN